MLARLLGRSVLLHVPERPLFLGALRCGGNRVDRLLTLSPFIAFCGGRRLLADGGGILWRRNCNPGRRLIGIGPRCDVAFRQRSGSCQAVALPRPAGLPLRPAAVHARRPRPRWKPIVDRRGLRWGRRRCVGVRRRFGFNGLRVGRFRFCRRLLDRRRGHGHDGRGTLGRRRANTTEHRPRGRKDPAVWFLGFSGFRVFRVLGRLRGRVWR